MTTKAPKDNTLNSKENANTSGISYGDKRRQERQEALREFLQGQKYIEAIHNTLEMPISNDELQAIKFKTETRLKLLNKVLPDLKAIEQTTELHADVEFYAWQE
jgi:arsenate reductase-like glutaredoxin family protein